MTTPPTFWRSPRLNPNPPVQEIEIQAPPAESSNAGSLLTLLLPAVLMATVMVGLGFALGNTNWIVFMVPMMLASSLASVVVYFIQKRRDAEKADRRKQDYRKVLLQHARDLKKLAEMQLDIEHTNDPDPQECLSRVARTDRRLWARSPGDDDYLALRVGLGRQASSITVKVPQSHNPIDIDPLIMEARDLAEMFQDIKEMPIRLELAAMGIAGIASARPVAVNAARTLLIQLTTHHAPSEVKLAGIYSQADQAQWQWMRWLPHVWSDDRKRRYLAATAAEAHRLLGVIEDILDQRRRLKDEGSSGKPITFSPNFVVLIADLDLVENEPGLHRLLSEGPGLGVYCIFLREQVRLLPPACRAIVKLDAVKCHLMMVESATSRSFVADEAPPALAESFARAMAPIRLKEAAGKEIPSSVTLLEMFGVQKVADLNVEARWRKSQTSSRSLAVPVGLQMGSELRMLDLHERADGPNGLVAGMVGAGKSELLQTLVASLAVNYHPHRMAFVLVDFKGGGMADPFVDLPHTLGIITNLQKGNLAVRALTSFNVEARRRQDLFKQAGVNHIDAYQKKYYRGEVTVPLPYLVIIVDEFAEMKTEEPEVAKDFIRLARIGRSLGFRLILAMQKPAGIVDGQIEANTRFRLCLRVAQTEDSQAMLKRTEAAFLTGLGRAYLQVGSNEVFELFQVAYSGAQYDPEGLSKGDPLEIHAVDLDGSKDVLYAPPRDQTLREETQLEAVTAHLADLAARLDVEPLPGLWLPPLPEQLSLDEVRPAEGWTGSHWEPAAHWMAPVVGLLDKPVVQEQPPLRIEFGEKGHLAVYGAPGFGKTTFLMTLVTSLALTYSPADVNIYMLDFGGRLLKMFEPLPQVGGVVAGDEDERLRRLLDFLMREMDRRRALLGEARAATLPAYRSATGKAVPGIVVIIDNYANFYSAYEEHEDVLESIVKIARDGGNLGIHLVITATSESSVRFRLSSNISMAVALILVEKGDYGAIVGKADVLPEPVPGRGLVRTEKTPLDFQTALPASGESDFERSTALNNLIDSLAAAWDGLRAAPIPMLADVVHLPSLLAGIADFIAHQAPAAEIETPIGIFIDDLTAFALALTRGPSFLVTGPLQSGKTTVLLTWAVGLARLASPADFELYVLDSRKMALSPLRLLPHTRGYSTDTADTDSILQNLDAELERRERIASTARQRHENLAAQALGPALLLLVDDLFDPYSDTTSDHHKEQLGALLRKGRGLGFYLVAAGALDDISTKSWQEPMKSLKQAQVGLQVGSSNSDAVFNLRLPYNERDRVLPAGEGYWVERGAARKVKIAVAGEHPKESEAMIRSIKEQYEPAPAAPLPAP